MIFNKIGDNDITSETQRNDSFLTQIDESGINYAS